MAAIHVHAHENQNSREGILASQACFLPRFSLQLHFCPEVLLTSLAINFSPTTSNLLFVGLNCFRIVFLVTKKKKKNPYSKSLGTDLVLEVKIFQNLEW